MARSGAKRKQRPRGGKFESGGVTTRPATRPEYLHAEDTMFFPKLRRQAKWMFVFLALVFAVGFVAFGVGSGGGGIGDIFQGLNQSSTGGPSVKSAKKKIAKGNPAGYKDLAEAYRNDNKQDLARAAGEQYVRARPKDYDFMRNLASEYEGEAAKLRNEAQTVQDELNAHTGASIALPTTTPLGRMLGQTGNIDRELTSIANQKLTEQYTGIQKAYTRATQLYQRVAVAKPDDVLLQLLLAQSAYQARLVPTAEKAYKRVIKLAPDSPEAQQARQQLSFLRIQSQAAGIPSR